MSLSVTLDPAIALPAKQVRLIVSGNTGTSVAASIVSAPTQSAFYSTVATPVDVRLDVAGRIGTPTICFVPDVSGVYSIAIRDISQARTLSGSGRRNSFQGAADGYVESSTLQTLTYSFKVAERMATQVGAAGDYATLVLYIVDETITPTDLETYGEATPSLINTTSERARLASVSEAVQTKLAALDNITIGAALGSIPEILAELAIVSSEHLMSFGEHQNADETGAFELRRYRGTVTSGAGIISEANRVRSVLVRHMQNDSSDGPGAGLYHSDVDGYGYPDLNLPLAGSAVDAQSARILIADMHRCYESHRVQIANPPSHLSSDTTNVLTALPAMLALDSAFLSFLASQSPTAPSESNAGAVAAIFSGGFKPSTVVANDIQYRANTASLLLDLGS